MVKKFSCVSLIVLSLAGCTGEDQCAKEAAALDAKWADIKPSSKEEVRTEINELLAKNGCLAITPWRIRKVMTDVLASRQCLKPETLALKISSYTRHDSEALRDIAKEIADCPTVNDQAP